VLLLDGGADRDEPPKTLPLGRLDRDDPLVRGLERCLTIGGLIGTDLVVLPS
jgi:hypothetical protein